jgi:hypothetical protein
LCRAGQVVDAGQPLVALGDRAEGEPDEVAA